MKVREVMSKKVVYCGPETRLDEAIFLMGKHNCGFLPVVGDGGNVIGVITDRDMCMALGARKMKPADLRVWDVMPRKLFACTPDDDIHCALTTLREGRIRRLPVIDRDGALAGVLSIDDIVLNSREDVLRNGISYEDVGDAYKAILGRPPVPHSRGRVAVAFKH